MLLFIHHEVKSAYKSLLNRTLLGCIIAFVLFTLWGLRYEAYKEDTLLKHFQSELDAHFMYSVQELSKGADQLMAEHPAFPDQSLVKLKHADFALYRNEQWVYYSAPVRLPAADVLIKWANCDSAHVFQQGSATYAAVVRSNDSLMAVAWIPLKITYPIRNAYISNYIYTGDDDVWPSALMQLQAYQQNLLLAGDVIIGLSYSGLNKSMLTLPGRHRSIPWIILSSILLLVCIAKVIYSQKWSKWVSAAGMIAILVSIRGIMLITDFPGMWIYTEVFSPRLLAINEWNASLGDLFLNVLTLMFICFLLIRQFPRKIIKHFALSPYLMFWGTVSASGAFFFQTFQLMSDHSQIHPRPEEVLTLSLPEVLFFATSACTIGIAWMLIFSAGLRSFKQTQLKGMVIAFVLTAITGAFLITPANPVMWFSFLGFALLAWLQGRNSKHRGVLQLNFFELIFILLAAAWVTEVAVSVSYKDKQQLMLIRLASRFSESRDPVTEYLFATTVKRIQSDTELFRKQGRNRSLSNILLEDYIKPEFKAYVPRLYLYNQQGLRLDDEVSLKPMIHPFRTDPKLEDIADNTRALNLYVLPFHEDELIDKIYTGRFSFFLPLYGQITAILELIPRTADASNIYPRLLLDADVPARALPEGYDYAVYRNNLLIRSAGTYPFPLQWAIQDTLNDWMPKVEDRFVRLLRKDGPDKMVILQTPYRDIISRLVSASVLFFFFALLLFLINIPRFITALHRFKILLRNLMYAQKLRILLVGFSVVPFLGIVFLFRPFIQQSFIADSRELIQKDLQLVSNAISDELRIWLLYDDEVDRDELQNILVRARNQYGMDMNLYAMDGELLATTQPRVFEMGLLSSLIPFSAWYEMRSQFAPFVVQDESVGNMRFLSGYQQIQGADQRSIALLNIPYLSQQEVIDARFQNFMSTLVQLYLIVLLLLGGLSVVFSRILTQPLTFLRQRMDQTRMGMTHEPIPVKSGDEIGAIIKSYNRMLVQLKESEGKLAKTQRESAWKEMAKQVAHEIKNPLTPMKLSIQHLIRAWQDKDERLPDVFHKVTHALLTQIDTLSSIAGAFSSFATLPKPSLQPLDLREILQDVHVLYQQGTSVDVTIEMPDHPVWVLADKDQLSRVFQNLVKNSLQSIEHDDAYVKLRLTVSAISAKVDVIDNGKGIPDAIHDQIFQPNFSTKNSGMGLGLAMVKRMLESIQADIYFESQEGQGTVFHVDIPLLIT